MHALRGFKHIATLIANHCILRTNPTHFLFDEINLPKDNPRLDSQQMTRLHHHLNEQCRPDNGDMGQKNIQENEAFYVKAWCFRDRCRRLTLCKWRVIGWWTTFGCGSFECVGRFAAVGFTLGVATNVSPLYVPGGQLEIAAFEVEVDGTSVRPMRLQSTLFRT